MYTGQETRQWSHLAVDHVYYNTDQQGKICLLVQQWHNYLEITGCDWTGGLPQWKNTW